MKKGIEPSDAFFKTLQMTAKVSGNGLYLHECKVDEWYGEEA